MPRTTVDDVITPSLSSEPQLAHADVTTTHPAGSSLRPRFPYGASPAGSSTKTLTSIANGISNKTTSGSGASTVSYFRSLPTNQRAQLASRDYSVFSRMSVEARLAFKETRRNTNEFTSAHTYIPSQSLPEIVGTSFETKRLTPSSKAWEVTGNSSCSPRFHDRNSPKPSVTFQTHRQPQENPYLLIESKQTFMNPTPAKCAVNKWSVPRFPVLKFNDSGDVSRQRGSSVRHLSGHVIYDDVATLKRDVGRSQTAGVVSNNNFRVTGSGYDSRFVSANQTKTRVYLAQLDDDDVSMTDDVIAKSIAKCTAWLQSIVS